MCTTIGKAVKILHRYVYDNELMMWVWVKVYDEEDDDD